MKRRNKIKAFTIVELVIVIALIAVLATVLVPVFGDVINNAQESAAKQAAKNAYTSYLIENNGAAPKMMVYKHASGKVVALENGAAVHIYKSEADYFAAHNIAAFKMDEGMLYSADPSQPDVSVEVDWAGKTILFLGDSLPHGQAYDFRITTPYPQIVAESLGMKLQNYGIGGSTIAYKENYGGAFATYEDFLAAPKDPDLYYQVINGQSAKTYKCDGSDVWTENLAIHSGTGAITEMAGRTTSPMYANPGSITITIPEGIEMYIAAYDRNGNFLKDKFTGGYLAERTKTVTKEEAAYIRIMVRTIIDGSVVPAEIAAQTTLVDGEGNKVTAHNWIITDEPQRTPLTARFDLMTDDADVIVVHCGTNDFQYNWTGVGTPTDRTNHTFYGALNNLILALQDKYPSKPIIFMTPLQRMQGAYNTTESKNSFGYTLKDYRDIILTVCASYDIPVIDTYEIGPSPYNSEQAGWFDSVGTHPNQVGHNLLGKIVAEELRELFHVKDHREQWVNKYQAPLEFGSMTVQGGLLGTDNDLFYKRARSSAAVTAEEEIAVTFTGTPAARFRLCVYNTDGTLKVFHNWAESAATYTVYAGESFRLFFSAGDSGKVLTEADLIAFAEAIRIEAKG